MCKRTFLFSKFCKYVDPKDEFNLLGRLQQQRHGRRGLRIERNPNGRKARKNGFGRGVKKTIKWLRTWNNDISNRALGRRHSLKWEFLLVLLLYNNPCQVDVTVVTSVQRRYMALQMYASIYSTHHYVVKPLFETESAANIRKMTDSGCRPDFHVRKSYVLLLDGLDASIWEGTDLLSKTSQIIWIFPNLWLICSTHIDFLGARIGLLFCRLTEVLPCEEAVRRRARLGKRVSLIGRTFFLAKRVSFIYKLGLSVLSHTWKQCRTISYKWTSTLICYQIYKCTFLWKLLL